jgi:2'-5' RNA ligase
MFCAIELPDHIRSLLQDHIRLLRKSAYLVQTSWSRPESIHLTLKFFGSVEQSRVEMLSAAVERATRTCSPFQIRVGGTGVFPPRGTPRVLWVGISDPSGKLANLQLELERQCEREGFPSEARPFQPHLTIARIRRPQGSRSLAEIHKTMGFETVSLCVSELLVFRSELSNEGSTYSVISTHPLSDEL